MARRLAGLKDSAGDLAYARAVVAAVPGFDVFPSSEAALGAADADGFAGCISATVNLTARRGAGGLVGARHAGRRGGGRARPPSCARSSRAHPLVAAVKAALAARYRDPAWARVCLPLVASAAPSARRGCDEAFERRAAEP